ncbi:class I SAM-dependent methyltransferase family protein [Methanolobus sediminis]|uniref:tRNA (guanine(37)-N(1))-methyltransferase n=1 Tax=Methanolobus sediminis TaxID=3072978 RepID=A0AA51UN17_9EURY|nr:class I SAM-dependent methyltransferase family protein [Methanolobus sediminis]WMW26344.1 class I SAM-dependent methyltransferase family protein [Methanolobus sediminis]
MSLKDELKGKISEKGLEKLPNRFDIVGDIAVVSIPDELESYKEDIACAITGRMQNIKNVLNKVSKLEGNRRVAGFEIIAGNSTETIHKEFGFSYKIDLRQSFFNGRLSYERKRVASLIKPEENILVPFSGVGPFAIPAAASAASVVAVEMNRAACKSFITNRRLNGLEDKIHIINADANSIPNLLKTEFDRAIIPTPYGMDHFLETISPLVKKGGFIHFYTFKPKEKIPELIKRYESMGFEVLFHRRCGNVAPGISRWVFDLKNEILF